VFLARLLEQPGVEIPALELIAEAPDPGAHDPHRPLTVTGDAGELLDPQARAAYRRRLVDLADELAAAEGDHDLGRIARLRAETES
jgi:hypothetical protein